LQSLEIGSTLLDWRIEDNGIDALGVSSLSLEGCSFYNVGDARFDDAAVLAVDPAGIWSLNNCAFERSFVRHIDIQNNDGANSPTINVRACTFENNLESGVGEESLLYTGGVGSSVTLNVTGCHFTDSADDHIRVTTSDGASAIAQIGGPSPEDGNVLENLRGGRSDRDGLFLESLGTLNYLVQGNRIVGCETGVRVEGGSFADLTGNLLDNIINTEGDIVSQMGLFFLTRHDATNTFTAEGNLVRQTSVGCQVETGDRATTDGTLLNNDLASSEDPRSSIGLAFFSGRIEGGEDASIARLDIRGNAVDSTTSPDILFSISEGSLLQLPGYTGPVTGAAAVDAVASYLTRLNIGVNQATGAIDGTVTGGP
jgi:hypothetical protein